MPDCYHVVIKGNERDARAFIEGLVVGADAYGSIYFVNDLNEDAEGFISWFKGLVSPDDNVITLLVDGTLHDILIKGINDSSHDIKVEVVASKRVEKASFCFEFKVFSKEHGEAIKKLLEELPTGVEITEETKFKTNINEEAAGVELYSPVHEYEYKGRGCIFGQVRKVVEIYQKAQKEPLIQLDELKIEFE